MNSNEVDPDTILSKEDIEALKQGREDMENGETVSLEELEAKLKSVGN